MKSLTALGALLLIATVHLMPEGFHIHSRETAELFGVEPTGNARAWGYTDVPIIRMRNTYIKPGKNSIDEIIGSIDKGYLLVNPENGEADANAEFMFGCGEAYEIAKNKFAGISLLWPKILALYTPTQRTPSVQKKIFY